MCSERYWMWRSFLCGEGWVWLQSLWFGIRFQCLLLAS
uniref:Uncharacterized protein n=1 Tax=Anguilla anguilla TaxID=7936 RepID=A0A0E9UIZ0_ANGAN